MKRTLLTISTAFALAACSSGSSGDDTPTPPAFVQSEVLLTSDNALVAAKAGVRSSFDIIRLTYIGADFLQTPIPEPEPEPEPQPVVLGSTLTQDIPGPEGGNAAFTWDDVDGSGTYTSGDEYTINFVSYGDEGMVLDGVMTITEVQLQGLLPGNGTFLLNANLNMLGLTVTNGATQQTFSQTFPFYVDNRILVEIFDLFLFEPVTIDAFEVQKNTRLIRYETSETIRYEFDGAVFSPELEGTVRFDTPTYMASSAFLSDPTDGTLRVRGAFRSSVEIEPNCLFPGFCIGLDVRVDADGDEEFEETLSTSWAGLLPE